MVWCQGRSQGLFVFTRSKGACDPQTHCSVWFPKPQIKLGFCVSPSHTSFGVQGVAPVLPEQWLCTSPCSPKTSSLELKNVCVLYSWETRLSFIVIVEWVTTPSMSSLPPAWVRKWLDLPLQTRPRSYMVLTRFSPGGCWSSCSCYVSFCTTHLLLARRKESYGRNWDERTWRNRAASQLQVRVSQRLLQGIVNSWSIRKARSNLSTNVHSKGKHNFYYLQLRKICHCLLLWAG